MEIISQPRPKIGGSLSACFIRSDVFKAWWRRDLYFENLSEILPRAMRAKTCLAGGKPISGILRRRHTP